MVKRSGVTEPFSRAKVMSGVRKACQGRPVDEDAIALLAQRVEETIRARGAAEVPSHEVGLAILGPLRELDEVAYLRFASVYRSFDSLERLRAGDRGAAGEPSRKPNLTNVGSTGTKHRDHRQRECGVTAGQGDGYDAGSGKAVTERVDDRTRRIAKTAR